MKKRVLTTAVLVLALVGVLTVCFQQTIGKQQNYDAAMNITNADTDAMYSNYIQTLLEEDLWSERDAYDTAHYLMLPMWYAFEQRDTEKIQMFTGYMKRFSDVLKNDEQTFDELAGMTKPQHLYFVTEYMCLMSAYEMELPDGLYDTVLNWMEKWCGEVNVSFQSKALELGFSSFWEVLDALIDGDGYEYGKSYDYYIADNELYTLAILCDLNYVAKMTGRTPADSSAKAAAYIDRITDKYISWKEDGTWQYQEGVLYDYSDMAYAGIENVSEIEEGHDYRVENIVQDSSHFSRWPLWLRSFRRGGSSPERYSKLLEGLGKTFEKYVLVCPDEECSYYRLKNYMNGVNGLFRYNYNGDGKADEPYHLSVNILLGWWSFCDTAQIKQMYEYTCKKFPMDEEGKFWYTDGETVREQNKIFVNENYRQFICYLASELNFSDICAEQ